MTGRRQPRGGLTSSLRDTALGRMWVPEGKTPCASMPDEFAELDNRGRNTKTGEDKKHLKMLKDICHTCDFTSICLEAALEEEGGRKAVNRHGMRGATTPTERETIARNLRKRTA